MGPTGRQADLRHRGPGLHKVGRQCPFLGVPLPSPWDCLVVAAMPNQTLGAGAVWGHRGDKAAASHRCQGAGLPPASTTAPLSSCPSPSASRNNDRAGGCIPQPRHPAALCGSLLCRHQGLNYPANGDGWPGLPGLKLILHPCWPRLLSLVITEKHFFLHIMAQFTSSLIGSKDRYRISDEQRPPRAMQWRVSRGSWGRGRRCRRLRREKAEVRGRAGDWASLGVVSSGLWEPELMPCPALQEANSGFGGGIMQAGTKGTDRLSTWPRLSTRSGRHPGSHT